MIFRKNKILVASIFFTIVALVLFVPAIFQNKSIYFGDNYHLLFPQKLFYVNSIKNLVIPFWNPYVFNGIPFLADINHSALYPSTVLFLILNEVSAMNLTIIIHIVIGGVGTYLVSRSIKQTHNFSLIAGILWIFSEFMLSIASSNLSIFQSSAWLPWILFSLFSSFNDLRKLYFLPLFISLSFLGGHPQLLAYLMFLSSIFLLFSRSFKQLFGMLISLLIVGIINIAIIVPFVELSQESTRINQPWDDKIKSSLPVQSLIQWIIPTFFSNPEEGIFWGPDWDSTRVISGYSTLIVLLGYGLLFRHKRTIKENYVFFIGLSSLLLSLGNSIPFIWEVLRFVPVLNGFRNPALLVGLWSLSVAILSGPALNQVKRFIERYKKKIGLVIIMTILIIVIIGFLKYYLMEEIWNYSDLLLKHKLSSGGFHNLERDSLILDNILWNLIISITFFYGSIIVLIRKKPVILLVYMLAIDMFLSNRFGLKFAEKNIYRQESAQAIWLNGKLDGQYRIISTSSYFPYVGINDYWNNALFKQPFSPSINDDLSTKSLVSLKRRADNLGADWNMVYGISLINGYGAFVLKDTARYWDNDTSYAAINDVDKVSLDDPRISDQGVKFITIDTTLLSLASLKFNNDKYKIAHQGNGFVILENEAALPVIRFDDEARGEITLNNGNINQIAFSYTSESGGVVLIKHTHYPGWKCVIGSEPCEILADNFTMKINVPAGERDVNLSFTPTGWPYLAYISGISWLVYLIFLIRWIKYEK